MTQYYGNIRSTVISTLDPNSIDFHLYAADRANGYEFQLKHNQAVTKGASSRFIHPFKPYLQFTEKTDIRIAAFVSNDKDGECSAGFDLILVDN
jgi:delta-aminolevulinic acid dehydratase/porphobilinogen synthase